MDKKNWVSSNSNSTDKVSRDNKKTGISLLRMSILILCAISFRNTALGLKQYIFSDAPIIAYLLSLVFQGVIAVVALQGKKLVSLNGETENMHKILSKKSAVVLFVFIVAFVSSVWFDFVYVVNSTYQTTEKEDIANGFATSFAGIKEDIVGWLNESYTHDLNNVYDRIEEMGNCLSPVGKERFATEWSGYWKNEKKVYKPVVSGYSVYELAQAKSLNDENSNESKLSPKQLEDEKQKYANLAVYSKISHVINEATLLKPEFITETEIDSINQTFADAQEYLKQLIEEEYKYSNRGEIDKVNNENQTVDSGEDTNEKTVDVQNETSNDKSHEQDVFEEIFSKSATEVDSVIENWSKKAADTYVQGKGEKEQPTEWRQASWQWRISVNQKDMLNELSQKRISACKAGIAVIDSYKRMLLGIKEDAKYNLALLVKEISSSETIDAKKIDEITAKISQTVFTAETEDSKAETAYKKMKETVSNFIPLKNTYILLRSIELSTADTIAEETKSQQNKDADDNTDIHTDNEKTSASEDGEKQKNDIMLYKMQIKKDVDLLIENLMALSAVNKDKSSVISENISSLLELENAYLNEKNEMVKAVSYFFKPKIDNKKVDDGRTRWLAVFAFLFAFLVDLLSLILGTIVQKWEAQLTAKHEINISEENEDYIEFTEV